MFDKLTSQLRQLKLHGMAIACERQNEQPNTDDNLSFTEWFQLLVDSEATERDGRKQDRLIKASKFKISANAEDIDYQNILAHLNESWWLNYCNVAGLLRHKIYC